MPTQSSSKQINALAAHWQDHTGRLGRADLEWLHAQTHAAMSHLGVHPESSVRIDIVDDAKMTATHARCMGINETTDVLTFDLRDPLPDTPQAAPLDTDIMLCLDEAARQASARSGGNPSTDETRRELLLYAVHGILHCLGHDDHDETDYQRMHAAEDEVLKAIGVGPVFNAPA